jgi:catecholate siderophore receptor
MRMKIKRSPKYWVAVGTLAAYSAIGTRTGAYAQDRNGAQPQPPLQNHGALPVFRFDIPPGTLDEVLRSFQNSTGVKVLAPSEGIRSLESPGVSGLYTTEQALQLLLKGTGVDYHFTGAHTVALALAAVTTTVEVAADAGVLATSMPKYNAPLRDTPQSISVVSAQVMEAQGATTLRDALRNVAGISMAAGEAGAQGDNLTVRGFSARNDLFIDGMRDFGSYYRDPFNTEEVEVLQGPSSVTFGRGSTGGVVNQATKAPQLPRFIRGDVDFGTDATRRVALDVNTPVPQLGEHTAFRVNLMGNKNNFAGRDIAENRRFGIAPSLMFGLGTPTRLTLSYFHQTGNDVPDYGIPWLFNGPAPVNRNNYYGFKDANYLRTCDDIGTARLEHDVNSITSIRNQTRYANYVRHVQITEPQVLNPSLSTPLSQLTINRNQLASDSVETYLDDQLDATIKFETAHLKHTLVTGVEAGRETSDPTRPKYTNVPTTSLLNPDTTQPFTGIAAPSSQVTTTSLSASAYALDSIELGRKWILSGGIRWDRFDSDYHQYVAPASALARVDNMPTWRAAIVYKPVPIGTFYVDAGTSFNPSAEALSLSAATANLPPEKNRTYEAGTKWDLNSGRLSLRSALFDTEKTNAREPDPNNVLLNVLAGTQRVRGVQVEARGHLMQRWELLSSYSYLDSRVVNSKYYPAAIGARLANVPTHTFNIWTEYHLPKRIEIGAGSNFVSSRTASSTVPLDPITGLVKQVPGYWVFNAMASRSINEHVSVQANVYNVTGRYYYDQIHPGHIVLGPGRSATVSIKFKF